MKKIIYLIMLVLLTISVSADFQEDMCESYANNSLPVYNDCLDYFDSLQITTFVNTTQVENITIIQEINTSQFVQKSDLNDFLTNESLSLFLSEEAIEELLKGFQRVENDTEECGILCQIKERIDLEKELEEVCYWNGNLPVCKEYVVTNEAIISSMNQSEADKMKSAIAEIRELVENNPKENVFSDQDSEKGLSTGWLVLIIVGCVVAYYLYNEYKKKKEAQKQSGTQTIIKDFSKAKPSVEFELAQLKAEKKLKEELKSKKNNSPSEPEEDY